MTNPSRADDRPAETTVAPVSALRIGRRVFDRYNHPVYRHRPALVLQSGRPGSGSSGATGEQCQRYSADVEDH
jgi:hypothetical protein